MNSTTTPISPLNTATAGTRFRYLDREFETAWTPAIEHDGRIVRDSGDLILTLQDLWDIEAIRGVRDVSKFTPGCSFGEFIDEDTLERWADGWSFFIEDLNTFNALYRLVYAFVLPTIAELPDKTLHRMVQESLNGQRNPSTVPAYTLRVDGSVIRHFLVDNYDGPFTSGSALKRAMLRRTVR